MAAGFMEFMGAKSLRLLTDNDRLVDSYSLMDSNIQKCVDNLFKRLSNLNREESLSDRKSFKHAQYISIPSEYAKYITDANEMSKDVELVFDGTDGNLVLFDIQKTGL